MWRRGGPCSKEGGAMRGHVEEGPCGEVESCVRRGGLCRQERVLWSWRHRREAWRRCTWAPGKGTVCWPYSVFPKYMVLLGQHPLGFTAPSQLTESAP